MKRPLARTIFLVAGSASLACGCAPGDGGRASVVAAPAASSVAVATPGAAPIASTSKTIPLAGGDADGVAIDYLIFDAASATVWVPSGNSASVNAIDTTTGKLTRIEGFATHEVDGRDGKKRIVGPSSVTAGEGVIYVGNRADGAICTIDPKKLTKGLCGPKLDAMPDGIAYVATTREVWVTTPRDQSIRVLDAVTLRQKERIALAGKPEGYAVDAKRGRFYTNLEDKDVTLAIDLKSRKTISTFASSCGEEGPRGLRLAEPEGFLFVACSDKIEVMDVGHGGAILSVLDTGGGVDDIDYVPATRSVYAGAANAAVLVIARADDRGVLAAVATIPTQPGARNPAVDASGNVYLAHAKGSEILVVSPAKR